MFRRISNILPSSSTDVDVEAMEAAIFRVWRTAFPHLPSRFGPAWDFHLDTQHKKRSKLLRKFRRTNSSDHAEQYRAEIRDKTKEIRTTVKHTKRIIILLIIDAFSPRRITAPDFHFSECCPASPLPNLSAPSKVDNRNASDTRVHNLLLALQSDDSQLAQLCAIVKHVPHFHLTRVLGERFIRRFPHLQLRTDTDVDQTQLDHAVATFLKRSHWHCCCGSMCSQLKHPCSVG